MLTFSQFRKEPVTIWSIGQDRSNVGPKTREFGGPGSIHPHSDLHRPGVAWAYQNADGSGAIAVGIAQELRHEQDVALRLKLSEAIGAAVERLQWMPATLIHRDLRPGLRRANWASSVLDGAPEFQVQPSFNEVIRCSGLLGVPMEGGPIPRWEVQIQPGTNESLRRRILAGSYNDEIACRIGEVWMAFGNGYPEFLAAVHSDVGVESCRALCDLIIGVSESEPLHRWHEIQEDGFFCSSATWEGSF